MPNRTKKLSEKIPLRIKSLRKQRNMTQKDLGALLYKSESTVRMWELGKSEPDNETINHLSNFFGVSTDYLLGKDFKLNRPKELWHWSEIEDYERASREEKEYLLFKFGRGFFPTDENDSKDPSIASEEHLEEDVIIYHRDGKTQTRKFTKEQMAMFVAMMDAIPETDKDI